MLYNNHFRGSDDLSSSPYVCMYRAAKAEKRMFRVTNFNPDLPPGQPRKHLAIITGVLAVFLVVVLLGHFALISSLPIVDVLADNDEKVSVTASDVFFSTLKGFGIKISEKQNTYFHKYFLEKAEVDASGAEVDEEAKPSKPIYGYVIMGAVLAFVIMAVISLVVAIIMLINEKYKSMTLYLAIMFVFAFVGILAVYMWGGQPIDRFRAFIKGDSGMTTAGLGLYIMLAVGLITVLWSAVYINAAKKKKEYDAMIEAVKLEERKRRELSEYMTFNQNSNLYALPYQPYGPIKRP